MNQRLIIPNAESFLFKGGTVGCLLIHGFTGTPNEMRWMGEHLVKEGFTVFAPRLPGHGTQPADMLRVHRQDWLASVEDGLNILKSNTDCQVTIGLSMGGVLSLLAAARFPQAGAVSISAPFTLGNDPRLNFIRWLYPLMPRHEKGAPDWQGHEGPEGHIDYPYYPTRAIAELNDLIAQMRIELPNIHIPLMLIHSHLDKGVPYSNLESIAAHVGSKDLTVFPVDHSGHVIIREPDRFSVFGAVTKFIHRVTSTI